MQPSFQGLTLWHRPQGYERLEERRYVYRRVGSDFRAVLDVDDVGLVTLYEGIWRQIAVSSG